LVAIFGIRSLARPVANQKSKIVKMAKLCAKFGILATVNQILWLSIALGFTVQIAVSVSSEEIDLRDVGALTFRFDVS
jgi:hypothetical protein